MGSFLFKSQIPSCAKGQTTCIHHKGRQLDIYCKKCQEPACTKCLTTVHKEHPLCDISEISKGKKEDIQNFIDETEKVDLVQIDQLITYTDKQLKDNTSHFGKLAHELKTQTNKLKQDLDMFTAKTLSLYQQMEEDNIDLLQTYKHDLEMYRTQLNNQVQECKEALQRCSDIQIPEFEILSSITLPVKPTLCTASFTPNRSPQCKLEQAVGKMDTLSKAQCQALLSQHRSVFGHMPFSTPQSPEQKVKRSEKQEKLMETIIIRIMNHNCIPKAVVLKDWGRHDTMSSVCPTTDGHAWICYPSGPLALHDRKGNVIQVITYNIPIKDMSLSPTTNKLWICDCANNITELVAGQLVHRFSTRDLPQCICVTASNHVIVGMNDQISKFTTEGDLVLTTWSAVARKPLVCIPWKIAECPVTHNVAVVDLNIVTKEGEEADNDNDDDDNEGTHHIVVMDNDFKELFVYEGEPGEEPFSPCGVVYNSEGNLLIGDSINNRILLVSGCGEFLRKIYTDKDCITAVGIDRKDDLWAVFGYDSVKILHIDKQRDIFPCVIL